MSQESYRKMSSAKFTLSLSSGNIQQANPCFFTNFLSGCKCAGWYYFCVHCGIYLPISAGLEVLSICLIFFSKSRRKPHQNKNPLHGPDPPGLSELSGLFKHKSTCPELQHMVTETLVLTVACLLIINPVTAENSDARLAWKDSLYGFSSFSLFLLGGKSARRPWVLRRRGSRACVYGKQPWKWAGGGWGGMAAVLNR